MKKCNSDKKRMFLNTGSLKEMWSHENHVWKKCSRNCTTFSRQSHAAATYMLEVLFKRVINDFKMVQLKIFHLNNVKALPFFLICINNLYLLEQNWDNSETKTSEKGKFWTMNRYKNKIEIWKWIPNKDWLFWPSCWAWKGFADLLSTFCYGPFHPSFLNIPISFIGNRKLLSWLK